MKDFVLNKHVRYDEDLIYLLDHGVAFQKDDTITQTYDDHYFKIYESYAGTDVEKKLNKARSNFVKKYTQNKVVDVGIGCGSFIQTHKNAFGYDVNEKAVEWLKEKHLFCPLDIFHNFDAFTFWDVIEHVPNPHDYFSRIKPGSFLFTSIPIFDDLRKIKQSKHYRPGEHLYYFTAKGFIWWMYQYHFSLCDQSMFETEIGRDSIGSFVFVKRWNGFFNFEKGITHG